MEMNKYQKRALKEFVFNNVELIRNKEYIQIYDLLQDIDNDSPNSSCNIINCFTEMMFKIGENPFENVKEIYYGAGKELSIINLIIPDSVTIIGEGAFMGCEKLKKIKFSKNLKTIMYAAFGYCRSLQHLDIPNSVMYIEESAFANCTNLKSIRLGANIEKLDMNIFYNCPNLKDIYYNGNMADWMQVSNWTLGIPEECILHCIEGNYSWNSKNQNWETKE